MSFIEPVIAGKRMTFEEFQTNWLQYWSQVKTEQRHGQSLSNYLHMVRPDLFDRIIGTSLDPFYQNEFVDDCLQYLAENW